MSNAFSDQLTAYQMQIQLVLDGAIVANIEDHLESFHISGRPLFRETTDPRILLAGPWLVSPALERVALERCIAAARSAGKGVFWLGALEPDALYKHLRHLNAARMPDGRILYFRHYDADVLAAVVPLLDAEQAAYLFGPTRVIGFIGGCGDGACVERPEGLPEAPIGPLSFEPWQIEDLDKRQEILSRQKIAQLLRKGYAKQIGDMSDTELNQRVLAYEFEARAVNLTSKAAIANWARLDLETNGLSSKSDALKKDISNIPPQHTNDYFLRSVSRLIDSYQRAIE